MGYGLSPFAAMSRSADVDNAITEYLKIFFQRGAAPNVYLKFDVPMDDTTISQVKHRFMEIYGGYEKWSDVGVMDQGGTINTFGQDFKQMAFEALDYRNESRITGPFGVPLTVLNTLAGMSGSTYSNKETDRRIFWEDHMLPELGLHESEYQYYLRADDGAFVAFDTRRVPALRKDRAALANAFVALFAQGGWTKNQAAAYLDMDAGEFIDGDTVYMPLNLIPMNSKPTAPAVVDESAVPDATNPEQQAKALDLNVRSD
jgi:phage portal protein BeeE